MTGQAGQKMTVLAQGTADGTAKNMMGQTNILKAKL